MSKSNLAYFERKDVLHLSLANEQEAKSVELGLDITAALNTDGELIGVEILNANKFIRDTVLDSVSVRAATPKLSQRR